MAQNFTYTYLCTNALDILITFFEMVYKNIHKCEKKYHTRTMRREFLSMVGKQIYGKIGFLREEYKRLTGDNILKCELFYKRNGQKNYKYLRNERF